MMFGQQIFAKLNKPLPEFLNLETKKKFLYMFGLFYLGGMVQ